MQSAVVQDLIKDNLASDNIYIKSEQPEKIMNPEPLRFWEIEYFFKCPVIGTCLNIDEQKQLLKKAGISFKKRSPFEIHEILVSGSESENRLSRKVDCLLNRKLKREMETFFYLEEDEFMRLWQARSEDGQIEGIFWVAVTRPDLSKKARRAVFGDIHMDMHFNAVQNRKLRQSLTHQQEENAKLTQRLNEAIRTRRDLKKQNEQMAKELHESNKTSGFQERKNQKLKKELSELREHSLVARLRTDNQELQAEIRDVSAKMNAYQQKLMNLEDKNSKALSRIDRERKKNAHLKLEMERNITQIAALYQCNESCPSFDLCQKRILIVGGITRMEALYRQLIEDNGGSFDYHDGYTKRGVKSLENQVRRADMVLCPTNCNSHTACLAVKRLGKKYRKQVQMLSNSSLNTISQILLEYHESMNIQ